MTNNEIKYQEIIKNFKKKHPNIQDNNIIDTTYYPNFTILRIEFCGGLFDKNIILTQTIGVDTQGNVIEHDLIELYKFNGTQVFSKYDHTSFKELSEGYRKNRLLKFYENLMLKGQE
jgi:hypothetical protein